MAASARPGPGDGGNDDGGGSRWPRPASAIRAVIREGYTATHLRRDALAGLVVGIVALPLSMALAIAVGLPPQFGLYTAVVAGAVTAVLGGSRCQVTGPTAAFVVIIGPIVTGHGLAGLLVATAISGVMMILMALGGLGRLIQFVPYPVTTGFTAGIATVIASTQISTLLGLEGVVRRDHFHEVLIESWCRLGSFDKWDFAIGLGTLLLLIWVPRVIQRVPAPLLAIGAAGVVAHLLNAAGVADIATIASQFSYEQDGVRVPGIPPWPPVFEWPWARPGPGGAPLDLSWAEIGDLVRAAVAICILGAIESLLSAVAADSMHGTRHDPDGELLGQGIGNLLTPFFGGFASTGAIARTATNIRNGAHSPVAALVHALFLLVAMLLLAPLLGELPMSAMAALLLMVAWRMSDVRHFRHVLRTAPRSDVAVLLCCFGLTVAFDMVIGVTVGIALAGVLFMRRMAELTGVQLVGARHPELDEPIPDGVVVYEVTGPLFFGAAERAMRALHTVDRNRRAVVLDLEDVPTIDATGLVNLQSVLDALRRDRVPAILCGVRHPVAKALKRAHLHHDELLLHADDLRTGVHLARELSRR